MQFWAFDGHCCMVLSLFSISILLWHVLVYALLSTIVIMSPSRTCFAFCVSLLSSHVLFFASRPVVQLSFCSSLLSACCGIWLLPISLLSRLYSSLTFGLFSQIVVCPIVSDLLNFNTLRFMCECASCAPPNLAHTSRRHLQIWWVYVS